MSRLEWPPMLLLLLLLLLHVTSNQNLLVSIDFLFEKFQISPMGTNECPPHVDFFCYVGEELESLALFLTTPANTAALSHRYLVSGPSDARHLLHATSRLVGGALRRASTGICLTWASRHADRMRGGRGVGRWFRLPVCPAIWLHLNLVPKAKKQRETEKLEKDLH